MRGRYVAPAGLVQQARGLLVWPTRMAVVAQAFLGVSLATLAAEALLLAAAAACAYARCTCEKKRPPEVAAGAM